MADDISLFPSMDSEGLSFFKDAISHSNCFLEYGCGGSTSYAVNFGKLSAVISVDTSKEWVDKVHKSLSHMNTQLLLEHCDLGPIGEWGRPINKDRSGDFWRYMVTPWRVARESRLTPDTVLIDGRFRVAAFLYSLLSARVGTLIMFDDYLNRPHYFVVENFCRLKEKHGRMGVFIVENNYSLPDIVSAIAEYATVME